MSARKTLNRRQFLRGAAALAVAAPLVVRASAVGAGERGTPGNRIATASIGFRGQGGGHLKAMLGNTREVQVVGLCDVDAKVLAGGLEAAEKAYGPSHGVKGCNDFRDLLARRDLDAVVIATPDHWHAAISVAAMKAGKDVYCEKPMTLTIVEGRVMTDVARRYGRVLQCGTQQRSSREFRTACELVRNGRIGKLRTIRVGIPPNNVPSPKDWHEMPVPEGFDYDLWLGPAPWAPYHEKRCHYSFRFLLDYSGGQVTNWGAHYLDIGQWGNGTDDTGPVEVEGRGEFPEDGLFDTATRVDFTCTYANGVRMTCTTGGGGNTRFEGTDGWVDVTRGRLDAQPRSLLAEPFGPSDIRLYESNNHMGDFLECVRTRRRPIADVEIGHRTSTLCHLGNIAMLLGRKVRWDPERERFPDDAEADRMRLRPYREPWHL